MPGLFGIACLNPRVRLERHATEAALAAMEAALSPAPDTTVHRWTDPQGRAAVGRVGFPDLLPAVLQGSDGSPALCAYGSIHDSGRLAGEVAGDQFDAGNESLRSLRGSWVLFHQDARSGRMTLAVDRKASVPLVYARLGDLLVFAPEQKALLAFAEMPRELDPAAAASLLSSGYLLSHQALLRTARRLPGGHALDLGPAGFSERTYWRFTPGEAADGHSADIEQRMCSLIEDAVRVHLGEPDKTLIFLSGGADSRAILGAALRVVDGDARSLRTVTWGVDRGIPGSDVDIACRIAAATGIDHRLVARETRDYSAAFREVNAIIEGFSDVAGFHPHEYRLMQSLRGLGFRRVLRGDEVFGWSISVHDFTGAAIEVGIRRFGDLERAMAIVRPEHRQEWADASAGAWVALQTRLAGVAADRAKDCLYFDQRLQGMLGASSYYKQVVFDHRNVLLDDPILDLMSEVPDRERINKRLYLRAARLLAPELFSRFPLASRSSLENWSDEIAGGGSVREFLDEQLSDRSSPVWNVLDLEGVRALASAAASKRQTPAAASSWRSLRPWLRKGVYAMLPTLAARAHALRAGARLGVTEALIRSMVLKDWVDRVARTAPSVTVAACTPQTAAR